MKRLVFALFCLLFIMTLPLEVEAESAMRAFPQHSEYVEGSIQPSNFSQEELDAQVADYYRRWKNKYLKTVPGTDPVQKYIDWNVMEKEWVEPSNSVTVSEAHGYGMLILAVMAGVDENAKDDFDAMYNFYKAHPSKFNQDLMAWMQLEVENEDGSIEVVSSEDNDSATDGDMDIAYALLMADNQWGSDEEINYRQAALDCMDAIMKGEINQNDWTIQMGDWVKAKKDSEDFNERFINSTRSSDFMLNHLKVFANANKKNEEQWNKVYNQLVKIIDYNYENWAPNTGLLPDFLEKRENGKYIPAVGTLLETENDGDYNWNACRVPWRLSMDYLLTGDEQVYEQLSTLNNWIKEKTEANPLNINPGYYIRNGEEGEAIKRSWDGSDMSFIAPFAVSASIDSSNQKWLNNLWESMNADSWDKGIPFEEAAYFPNTIRMINMIVVSGNWWMPQ